MEAFDKICELFDVDHEQIARYYRECEPLNAEIEAKMGGLSLWALDREERMVLYSITKLLRPLSVVETGVGSGVSSSFILAALDRGTLHSVDLGKKYGNEEKTYPVGFAVPEKLRNKWVLHIGESKTILPELMNQLGEIQLFLHDSEHTYENVWFELSEAWNHISSGVILLDNYDWTEAPKKFAQSVRSRLVHLAGDMAAIPKRGDKS